MEVNNEFKFGEIVDVISKKLNSVVEGKVESIRGHIVSVKINSEQEMFRVGEGLILKQWTPGREFQKYNRVDIRSKVNKLIYEGIITQVNYDHIVVSYKQGENIIEDCYYYSELDNLVFPVGKFSSRFNPNIHTSDDVNKILYSKRTLFNPTEEFNIKFEQEVKSKFIIYKIQGDGNCLYRSFAHQIYGYEEFYELVKDSILEYINLEKEFFSQFIPGGKNSFDQYMNMKRVDGVWGDDLEIQACSELYNRSIHIYADSLTPLKTFHEEDEASLRNERLKCESNEDEFNNNCNSFSGSKKKKAVINLSYHGKAHYNSLLPLNKQQFKLNLLTTKPGEYELNLLSSLKDKKAQEEQEKITGCDKSINNNSNSNDMYCQKICSDLSSIILSSSNKDKIKTESNAIKYSPETILLMFSRGQFKHSNKSKNIDDLLKTKIEVGEEAKEASDNEGTYELKIDNNTINNKTDKNDKNDKHSNLEQKINKSILNQTEAHFNEEEILKSVMEESCKEYNKKNNDNNFYNDFIDKEKDKHLYPYENIINDNSTSGNSINFVVEMGFTVEEATIAFTAVGSDPELMLQYLYSLQHY